MFHKSTCCQSSASAVQVSYNYRRRAENYGQWITITSKNNGKYKVKDQEMLYKKASTGGLRNRADGRL